MKKSNFVCIAVNFLEIQTLASTLINMKTSLLKPQGTIVRLISIRYANFCRTYSKSINFRDVIISTYNTEYGIQNTFTCTEIVKNFIRKLVGFPGRNIGLMGDGVTRQFGDGQFGDRHDPEVVIKLK